MCCVPSAAEARRHGLGAVLDESLLRGVGKAPGLSIREIPQKTTRS